MGLMRAEGPALTANFTRNPKEIFDWINEEYWGLLSAKEILPLCRFWGTLTKQMTVQSVFILASCNLESGNDTWVYFSVTEETWWPDLSSTTQLLILTSFFSAARSTEHRRSCHFLGYKQKGHYWILGTWSSSAISSCSMSYLNCFFWCCADSLILYLSIISLLFFFFFFVLCFTCPVFYLPSYIFSRPYFFSHSFQVFPFFLIHLSQFSPSFFFSACLLHRK